MLAFKASRKISTNSAIVRSFASFGQFPKSSLLKESDVVQRVVNVVNKLGPVAPDFPLTSHFVNDFGLDSLLRKELLLKLGVEFCVPIEEESDKILSVSSAISYFANHPKAR